MLDESVAVLYAKTFYVIASERKCVENWKEQLDFIFNTIKSSSFLAKFFSSPCIAKNVKKETAEKLFATRIDAPVLNLIKILIDKNRAEYLKLILEMYKKQIMIEGGILEAVVKTATEISADGKARLENAISKHLKSRVKAIFLIDPSIIAGVVVTVDAKIIDWSLTRRLEEIKNVISSAPIESH